LRMGSEVYHELGGILEKKYGKSARNVGDEGGYAPQMKRTEEALGTIGKAIEECGYEKEVKLALDCAASSFFAKGRYAIDGKKMSADGLLEYYEGIAREHQIISIEDPFEEGDEKSFAEMTRRMGKKIQIVGDDLLVSNPAKVKEATRKKLANALLLKVNQVGTVSEAIEAADIAKKAGWGVIVSHRSGETEDAFIADFAVGIDAGQIKTGSLSRGERTCKYNQLLRIEEELGAMARFGKG